jgi:transcriptional regulator with XRE-family HTH domain
MALRFDPDPIDIAVGLRLRSFRKAKRLSQAEMGERLGVTFQQIQKYESGANRISASMMMRAARALSISPGELLPEDDLGPAGGATITRLLTRMRGAEALIQAYAAIPNARLRRAVLAMARAMAAHEGQPQADTD